MYIFVRKKSIPPQIYTHTHTYVMFVAAQNHGAFVVASVRLFLSFIIVPCCACVSLSSLLVIESNRSMSIIPHFDKREILRGAPFSHVTRAKTPRTLRRSLPQNSLFIIPVLLLLFIICDDSHTLSLSSYYIIYSNHRLEILVVRRRKS